MVFVILNACDNPLFLRTLDPNYYFKIAHGDIQMICFVTDSLET